MRQILTITKGNIRKNKGVYFSIFILMTVVSIALCSVLTFTSNSKSRVKDGIKEVGFGEMFAVLYLDEELADCGTNADEIISKLEACKYVEKVESLNIIESAVQDCNGESYSNSVFLFPDNNGVFNYRKYDKKGNELDITLSKGEVAVPIVFEDRFKCKVGDSIYLGCKDENYEYKIACFIEDPFMGSSMMGIKTLLISDEDYETMDNIFKAYGEDDRRAFVTIRVLNIFQDKSYDISSLDFEKEMNKASSYSGYCAISLSSAQAENYMLMLTNIFSGVLVAFIVLLLVAALVVLSHNINSTIDHNYTNLGILKAVGMTNGGLRISLIIGYVIATITGFFVGIPLSIPVVSLLRDITKTSSGLYISKSIDYPLVVTISIIIVFLIAIFVALKTMKLSKVTPLRAITGTKGSTRIKNKLKLPISKKILNGSLAYRQLISEKKQYIAAMIVTAILSTFAIMMNCACKWINDDQTLKEMFFIDDASISAEYDSPEIEAKAEEIIASYTEYDKFRMGGKYFLFNDAQINGNVIEDPKHIISVHEGRTCEKDNEILITKYIKDKHGLDIGDEVAIEHNGKKLMFVVSGIYECSNDTGNNFAMNYEGLAKFYNSKEDLEDFGYVNYKLKDEKYADNILEDMRKLYVEDEDYYMESYVGDSDLGGVEIIKTAINGITVIIYVIGAIFIAITVSIVCGRIISKEKKDNGIYKAMGFTSGKLRKQLAVRFAVTAFFGSILGVIISAIICEPVFSMIFSSFGMYYNSINTLDVKSVVVPIVFMTVVFSLCAYRKARKIKKLEPRILIAD